MSKYLVAYFSASGSTARLAQTLAAAADAQLYEIRPAVPYERRDLNWMDKKSRTTLEMQDLNCRPALAEGTAPVAEAEVVFLGFPIWWYREPWTLTISAGKRSCPSSPPAEANWAKARAASKSWPVARGSCPANASPPELRRAS